VLPALGQHHSAGAHVIYNTHTRTHTRTHAHTHTHTHTHAHTHTRTHTHTHRHTHTCIWCTVDIYISRSSGPTCFYLFLFIFILFQDLGVVLKKQRLHLLLRSVGEECALSVDGHGHANQELQGVIQQKCQKRPNVEAKETY